MMAPVNRLGQVNWLRTGTSVGWPTQGPHTQSPILAQPPFEGPTTADLRVLPKPTNTGGMILLQPEARQDGHPSDWVQLAGGWLGSAWATFRSGLRRLSEAMGPTPPPEGAPGAAALSGLELVGGVAQTALTPVVAAMGAAGQAGVAVGQATAPLWQSVGQGLGQAGQAASQGLQAVGQGFADGATAVAGAVANTASGLSKVLGGAWDSFWGAFQGQARR